MEITSPFFDSIPDRKVRNDPVCGVVQCSRIFFSLIRTSSVFRCAWRNLKKVQEFYYGDNPLNDALSKVNSEDMNLFFQALTKNPARLIEMQSKWWSVRCRFTRISCCAVWTRISNRCETWTGWSPFQRYTWQEPNYDLLTQSYLHFSQLVQEMLDEVEGIPDKVRQRIHFYPANGECLFTLSRL